MGVERKLKIFLCHSSGDKPAVRDLYKRLQADGLEPWLDEEDLLPGQKWQQEIPRAVRAADAILVCLSRDSIAKDGYVQKEIKYALDAADEKPEDTIFIIPLQLENCPIPERLKDWHVGNLYTDRGYDNLLRSLRVRAGQLNLDLPSPAVPFLSSPPPPPQQSSPPLSSSSLALPPTLRDSIGMEFVLIPAGEFLMGADNRASDEKPVRRVQITKPFYLGKYPVTQEQWQKVVGNNPSRFTGDLKRPVENVSWGDIQVFLQKLNALKGKVYNFGNVPQEQWQVFLQKMKSSGGGRYRLPTEAEWEYACRAGSTGDYCFGNEVSQLREYAWYDENSGGTTHPVGQLKPNAWGLYDMHGNVWEWVQDWYAEDYYRQRPDPDVDPQGPYSGVLRVLRGGSYLSNQGYARCACRRWYSPPYAADDGGVRVVVLP
ncbi:MAG: SUMF1/EgtB/PvdO family nonheme iron enzyme [Candidatus Binatia bacterium]